MQTTARMLEVAAEAGVSVTTVSNVLHQPDVVAPGTREKVKEAIKALKYAPSPKAAPLSKIEQGTRPRAPSPAPATGGERPAPRTAKSTAHINPYFTPDQAAQVRAALQVAGPGEGYASLSDLVVAATMEEVKRLQRKYNEGQTWPGVPAGKIRRGRPTLGEVKTREDPPDP